MGLTKEQINERKGYIGGSDAAAVLGLSRYKTILQVWAEKTGTIEPDDISDKLNVRLGNKMEAIVSELFTEETGKKVHRVNETLFHPNYPFIGANIDRLIVGENAGLEIKTTSAWMAKNFEGDELPAEYILQCYHYMAVTGKPKWYLAVLIGNNDFKIKVLERDEKIIKQIIAKEVDFWEKFVIPKTMPEAISARDSDTLFQIFPDSLLAGEAVELGDKGARFIETLKANQADLKVLENVIDQNKNELKAMLGENLMGRTGDWIVTWKTQTTKKLDIDRLKKEAPDLYEQYVKEIPSRVLRLTEIKKGE